MAASEMAYGEGHPATHTQQPAPTIRRMELSGIAFGEQQAGLTVPLETSFTHDCGPDQ